MNDSKLFQQGNLRISVVGCNCSGKTTFSHRLGEMLGIPHIQLDNLYWTPNWIPQKSEVFQSELMRAISQESWIIDGNYALFQDAIWSRATIVIWLNYPLSVVAYRTVKRTLLNLLTRSELYGGNFESFSRLFSRHSMLWLLSCRWRIYRRRYQPFFHESAAASSFPQIHTKIQFRSPRESEEFLTNCEDTLWHSRNQVFRKKLGFLKNYT